MPLLKRKPGALRNGAPFLDMPLPDELVTIRQHMKGQINGERDFAHILSYISQESLESVVSACKEALKAKTVSKDVIVNILMRQRDKACLEQDMDMAFNCPALHHLPQSNLNAYDALLSGSCS